jgi:D-glycero-D-manno-heptose 1,7-bisphosphate phosphatase
MSIPRQCAILVGGLGTRLGQLTAGTPKPLLDCGGRPFLAWIIRELTRFGIEEVVLLASYQSERVRDFAREIIAFLPKPIEIKLSVEPQPAGTGGAIWHARQYLDEQFMLINGDSWIDVNLARFLARAGADRHAVAHILLHHVRDASRYGVIEVTGRRITAFRERPLASAAELCNAGIYIFRRELFDFLAPDCSLERDILPMLATRGALSGETLDGYFIDIGIPADYVRANKEIPCRLRRGAVFFDRDGVLNEDLSWVGTRERFRWMEGAGRAVRLVNDLGYHAFIVTNQAGIAKGLYTMQDLVALHDWMLQELRKGGATIDDWRFCPHHPEASILRFKLACACRKPQPGMLLSLIEAWDVDVSASLFIGDKYSDIAAAERAGIAGHLYDGRCPVDEFLTKLIGMREALPAEPERVEAQ